MKTSLAATAALCTLASVVSSCSFDGAVDQDARISCTEDAHCPREWSCLTSIGECVPTESISAPPPALVAAADLSSPLLRREASFTLSFEVDQPLRVPPSVLLDLGGAQGIALTLSSQDGLRYAFSYRADGSEPQGRDCPITIDLVAGSGSRSGRIPAGVVRFDFESPSVAKASVLYLAASDNPLGQVTCAREGTRIAVVVVASEQLDPAAPPLLSLACGSGELVAPPQTASLDNLVEFEVTVPAGLADGTCVPSIAWQDLAGNAGTATFGEPEIAVKSSAPTLEVAQELVTYVRSPWGNDEWEDLEPAGTPGRCEPPAVPADRACVPPGPYFALAPRASRAPARRCSVGRRAGHARPRGAGNRSTPTTWASPRPRHGSRSRTTTGSTGPRRSNRCRRSRRPSG